MTGFDDLPVEALRRRRSAKWRAVQDDVLPMWVAELDVPLAPAVTAALHEAVGCGDSGYAWPGALAPAFAGFAARHWGWSVDPARCWPVADVMVGVGEVLRQLTAPGDGVVVCPPVYRPFWTVPAEHGRTVVPVPLTAGGGLDLAGIDAALGRGATAVLLCSPHNPTGRVWTAQELQALDDVVSPHGAVVLSDEIHAPLVLDGPFTPYLAGAERQAVALVSASKAFNLAGLKAALVVAGSPSVAERLARMSPDVAYRCGHLGVLSSVAAWQDGDAWLAALLRHLDRSRRLLADLLPGDVGYAPPQASYLAWLDLRGRGLASPAAHLLEHGRVALVEGTEFGPQGEGFVRLNFGTTRAVLEDGVQRLRSGLAAAPGA